MKRIGLITSGGDAPGMNACIRAITKTCLTKGITPIGYYDGYTGMMENRYVELKTDDVVNIIQRGGTILGTARNEEFKTVEGRVKAIENLKSNNIDGFICIGGDGSFRGASAISEEMNIPVIGIPATIDNDMFGTDRTIGFDTALNTVVEAVDKIKDTAGSHHRIFLVEVMGRDAGFIALDSALASGAASVLIPEERSNIELLAADLKSQDRRRSNSIVIVAEGDDAGGAKEIYEKLLPLMAGYTLRYSILGHLQRGGRPSAFDRILATRMGNRAVNLLVDGQTDIMVGANGDSLVTLPILEAAKSAAIPDLDKRNVFKQLKTVS
ncbi:MAG: 6-phosphofructokinase [Crocinitomicaceae bacterium]|nr:6-phosphofructokinase [Crocinitomicaceae bacterium]